MELIQTKILLTEEERAIIETHRVALGLPEYGGYSAAVRGIIREWNRLKSLEQSGKLRRKQTA